MTFDTQQFFQVLDLIVKWMFIKSNECSNTSFLNSVLTLIEEIFETCRQNAYQFMEAEGTILISMLVEKTGLNNATLQKKVIELLLSIGSNGDLYPV